MNWGSVLQFVGKTLVQLATASEPGVVTEADQLLHNLLQLVTTIAHPNTVAYKLANDALKNASSYGL